MQKRMLIRYNDNYNINKTCGSPLVVGFAVYVAVPVKTFNFGGQGPGALGTLQTRSVPSLVDREQVVTVEDFQTTSVAQVHLGLFPFRPDHHVGGGRG